MKKILVFILYPAIFFGQEPSIITTLEYGNRPLKINALEIEFKYRDESPSPDSISTIFTLNPSQSVNYFSIGFLKDNFKEKYIIGIKVDMFLKDFFGFNLDFTGGYSIRPNSQFQFGPKLDFTLFGLANKEINTIVRNTGYIQVNNTRFYSNVKVSFQNIWLGLRPTFFAIFQPTETINILGNIGYSLNASLANIGFSGRDIDGEQTSAVENINVENLTFDIITPSGVINPKKKSKIKYDGWDYSLGIGIKFNHLKKNK